MAKCRIIKGKSRDNILYDKIKFIAGEKGVILRQNFNNANVDMHVLIEMIKSLQSRGFAEVKNKQNKVVEHIGKAAANVNAAKAAEVVDKVDQLIDIIKK